MTGFGAAGAPPSAVAVSTWCFFHKYAPYSAFDIMNAAFLNGLAHVIVRDGLVDREFIADRTNDFESWAIEVPRERAVSRLTMVGISALRQAVGRSLSRETYEGLCAVLSTDPALRDFATFVADVEGR